jgi:TRAP-type mannitol/chloroaromatic compound transport system permease large subunit
MYLLGAISGSLAILVSYLPTKQALMVAALVVAAGLIGVALLERAPYEQQVKKSITVA